MSTNNGTFWVKQCILLVILGYFAISADDADLTLQPVEA